MPRVDGRPFLLGGCKCLGCADGWVAACWGAGGGAVPVREFRWYRGRRHYSGWYWAVTTSGHVVYESRLELARMVLADRDPDVVARAAQPVWPAELDDSRVIQSQVVAPGSRRCRSRA